MLLHNAAVGHDRVAVETAELERATIVVVHGRERLDIALLQAFDDVVWRHGSGECRRATQHRHADCSRIVHQVELIVELTG